VVLGASSFIPFMQLPSGHRREVIEDLLDINIFSKMNGVLKDNVQKLKEEFTTVTHKLDSVTDKIVLQKKFIKDLYDINDKNYDVLLEEVHAFDAEINKLQTECTQLNDNIGADETSLESKNESLVTKREKYNSFIDQFKGQIRTLVKDTKFYEDNDHCPTCDQDISSDLKTKKIAEASAKAKELKSAIDKATQENTNIVNQISDITSQLRTIRDKQSKVSSNLSMISQLQRQIEKKNKDIAEIATKDTVELTNAKSALEQLESEKNSITENRLSILESRTYYDVCAEMLKDSGIKTKIVKQYLPVMNSLINKYLQVLDFFVQFHLDENFDETIKSRHRDDFKYASFSEGEKMRINLALLFAWRQIAKMKNSSATNLLILDETFDASLDVDGTDNLLKILGTLDRKSVV
jgi:DNA repair exonuclease SbcCD ATPase subunit